MIDIASLVTLCQTALSLGSKFIEVQRRKKLSDAERELLLAAAIGVGLLLTGLRSSHR